MDASEPEPNPGTDPRPLAGVTGFKRDLLLTVARLSGTNPNGQAVKQELQEHYGEPVNHGRLYRNLDELVEAGFVRKLPLDGRTNVYRLTSRGDERLRAHREWEDECLLALEGDGEEP